MQEGQLAVVDELERIVRHGVGLGGKAGDQIGPEHRIGPPPPHFVAERHRLGARVAPLHALEDQVVARLQRQVEVRHQALFLGNGRNSSASASMVSSEVRRSRFSSGTALRIRRTSAAERRRAGQVGAIGGDVDAGQHDFGNAVGHQPAHLLHDGARRHRARGAAAERDDAEGAAVVAAVLHLDEGAHPLAEAVDHVGPRFRAPT
jgi:hypothetical protein